MYVDSDGDDGVDGDDAGNLLECHTDVSCSQGDNWQNESNAVAMIFDPLRQRRWCSGVLVNNACQNLRPMFLTAYHCVEWSDGDLDWGALSPSNVNSVNHFVFRFGYKKISCNSSSETVSISIYGADIAADIINSDVALFELRQKPNATSNINYAGWSRNQPNGQVTAIHHPQGNPMKISQTDVNSNPVATISPLSDFPSSAVNFWRVFFNVGAIEGGSSGAPYFDQFHRIIATHHASSRDCIERRGSGGRFDIAWNGAGISAKRLSDHLSDDPSVMTTNTIAVPSMNIPDDLCGNSPMSFINIPPNMSITGASISGAYLTSFFQSLAPQSGFNGVGFFELQLKPNGITCNDPLTLRKTFNVGVVTPEVELYHNWDCSGWVYVANVTPGTTYNWTVSYNGQTYYSQGTSVYLPQSGSGNVYYYLEASTACASTWIEGYRQLQGCGGPYSVKANNENTAKNYDWKIQLSPNPATNDLTISLSDYNERQLHTLGDVKVYNMTGQVMHQSKQILDNTMRMNIQNLNNGFYIIEIRGEGFSTRQRFNVSR